MQLPREGLDRRLAALDEAMIMLRAEYSGQHQLRTAFASAADSILAVAGNHRTHVSGSLNAILVANGLVYSRVRIRFVGAF